MPDKEEKKAKITYRTDERDLLRKLSEKYKCSPFTGECWTQEVSLQKIKSFYHIILTEEQMREFDDYIVDDLVNHGKIHQFLIMIKPTSEDNNYIFFRRL